MKTKLCLVALLSLVLLSMIPTSAHATPPEHAAPVYHINETYTVENFWVWNRAANEYLIASGTIRYTMFAVEDSAGGWHWTYCGHQNFIGFCPDTGSTYQVLSTVTQHVNTKDGCQYEWTFINTSPLICHGKVSNMVFTLRWHLTINANNEVTVSFYEFEFWCQGQK